MDILLGIWLTVTVLVSFVGWGTIAYVPARWAYGKYFYESPEDTATVQVGLLRDAIAELKAQNNALRDDNNKLIAMVIERLLRE